MAFHAVAKLARDNAGELTDPDVIASNAVLSAVAYADALTAAFGGRVNQKDHSAIVKLLRGTLGEAFPVAQERQLAKLIARKDEVQYGARVGRLSDVSKMIEQLDEFASWAIEVLGTRSVAVMARAPDREADHG